MNTLLSIDRLVDERIQQAVEKLHVKQMISEIISKVINHTLQEELNKARSDIRRLNANTLKRIRINENDISPYSSDLGEVINNAISRGGSFIRIQLGPFSYRWNAMAQLPAHVHLEICSYYADLSDKLQEEDNCDSGSSVTNVIMSSSALMLRQEGKRLLKQWSRLKLAPASSVVITGVNILGEISLQQFSEYGTEEADMAGVSNWLGRVRDRNMFRGGIAASSSASSRQDDSDANSWSSEDEFVSDSSRITTELGSSILEHGLIVVSGGSTLEMNHCRVEANCHVINCHSWGVSHVHLGQVRFVSSKDMTLALSRSDSEVLHPVVTEGGQSCEGHKAYVAVNDCKTHGAFQWLPEINTGSRTLNYLNKPE